jgi:hypothetical protein
LVYWKYETGFGTWVVQFCLYLRTTHANKPSTSCVRPACPKLSRSLKQTVNHYNNFVDIIRLVARLFQQVRYSLDVTILLQSCVVNLVTFLYIMTVSDLLEQPCNILVISWLYQTC